MGSQVKTRLGAILSIAAIVGLLFGVPLALILYVGWPLPTTVPTTQQLSDAFERDGVPLEVIVNGLAIVVWIAWAQLAWALGAETIALAQGRVARHARVWPGAQLVARNLVASAALVMSSLGGVRTAAAVPLTALQEIEPPEDAVLRAAEPGFVVPEAPLVPGAPVVSGTGSAPGTGGTGAATSRPSAPASTTAPASPPRVRNEQIYQVQRGDTFWGLAEKHLGSGMRWREIRDRNVGRAVAPGRTLSHGEDRLDVGWRIILPTSTPASPGGPQLVTSLPDEPLTAPAAVAPPGTPLSELEDLEERVLAEEAAAHAGADAAAEPPARNEAGAGGSAEVAAPPGAAPPDESQAAIGTPSEASLGDSVASAPGRDRVDTAAPSTPSSSPPTTAARPAAPPSTVPRVPAAAVPDREADVLVAAREAAEPARSGGAIPMPAAPSQPVTLLTVEPGDHFWGIAERQLEQAWGRPVTAAEIAPYWRTLIDANQSRIVSGDPDLIYPGQQFSAPEAPDSPEASAAAETGAPPAGEAPPTPPPDEAPPDESPPDDEPTATTAAPESPASTAPEEPAATAPTTEAPPPSTEAPAQEPEEPEEPADEEQGEEEQGEEEEQSAPPPSRAEEDGGVPGGSAVPTTAAPSPTVLPGGGTTTPAEGGGTATTAPADSDAGGDQDGDRAADLDRDEDGGVPLAVVAGTAALAGLVLAALARRRRARSRSLRPGGYVEPRLVADILTEREMAAAAGDVLDVVWATSRALGAVLAVKDDLPAVTAILVGPDRAVTVHFAEPCDPAPPFEVTAASDRWRLYLDDLDEVDLVSGPEPAVAVLDTLTVIGQTDADEWLFVDLESLGAVELDGDPVVAAELVQSMVTELSLQPASDHLVDLTVIGVEELSPAVSEQGVASVTELDQELVRRFEQSADETSGFLDAQGLRSTAAARAKGMARDGLFVTVVAYGGTAPADPVLLERLAAAATPGGRGVAVAAFGPLGSGATRVIVTGDGRAHIPRLGLTVNAARLDQGHLERISGLLDHEPETMPREPAPEWVVPEAGERDTVEPGPSRDEPVRGEPVRQVSDIDESEAQPAAAVFGADVSPDYLEPSWRYCVRIFADHLVETPEGEVISFRYGDNPDVPNKNTHRGPELLSYLALSGRAASATDVRDHLWWDRPVALGTVNKLLYGTRKVLGGADLLSLAQDDPVGRYRLSPEVVTDVELLAHALKHAHAIAQMYPDMAIDILRAHLARIETVAFRGGHLGQGLAEWAAAYRVVDRVEQPVIDAALLVAKLSTDRGLDGYEEALWAVDQGLFACPVNEALVRAAMEIEARLGSTDAVNSRYLTLAAKLARDELEPEPETIDLRARLGGGGKGPRGGRNGIR